VLWRQISEQLVRDIESKILAPGTRLPSDNDLATRFGVNRHTIRHALNKLETDGRVRSERGRGTFVSEDTMEYALGAKTTFEESVHNLHCAASRMVLSIANIPAPDRARRALNLKSGESTTMVSLLGKADDLPIQLVRLYFSTKRFPTVGDIFDRFGKKTTRKISLTKIMAELGVSDFMRRDMRVRCRLPTPDEARHLKMPTVAPVMEAEIVNVDTRGKPLFCGSTLLCGSRTELLVDLSFPKHD
jgi:GntR family transcriptional regulator, phosphonate transport system regulatory protein